MRRLAVVIGLLAAGACSVPPAPKPTPSVTPPGRWTGQEVEGAYAVPDIWWRDFEDETLDRYVRDALSRNPSLEAAEARVRAAWALARIAGADLYPQVGATADAARGERFIGELAFGAPPTQLANSFGVGLNLGWEIDLWGRIRAGKAAAVADAQAAEALFHGAMLSLSAQTGKAYFAAVEAELQVEVARENFESATALQAWIRERFRRGLRSALDLKLAETEVSNAKASLELRRRLRDAALRQLEILAGRYPDAASSLEPDLPEIPAPVPAGIPADILARRPDLVAAERQLAASAARVFEAQASLYPRISLTGSGGLTSNDLDDLLNGDFGIWSLAANLVAPIFTGGRLRANVDAAKAGEEEAVATFADTVLVAFGEVETSLAAEGFLADRETALVDAVEQAAESVDLSENRYLAGLTSILTVLESRRRSFAARSQLIRVRYDRLVARIDVYVSLGGGFRRDLLTGSEES